MNTPADGPSVTPTPSFAHRADYYLFGMLAARGLLDQSCSAELARAQQATAGNPSLVDVLAARCGLGSEEVDALSALLGDAPPTRLPRTLVTALRQLDAELSSGATTRSDTGHLAAQTPRTGNPLTKSETTRLDNALEKGGMVGMEAAGHFVLDRIGAGGQGEVYLAKQLSLDRYVALKRLDIPARADRERFIAAFRKEAKILARINHARIVKVHEVFITEDDAFFTMEYVNGRTLSELVSKAGGPLPPEVVANLACQACSALARSERDGLVHRDIKPANILVDENGDLKIIDFGLAAASETISGNFVGTPQFAAPEQARREAATPASDQYSLGVSLYFAATGRLPFDATHSRQWIEHHLGTQAPPPSSFNVELPPGVDAVLLRMLAKDPGARFSSFQECYEAWDHLFAHGGRQGASASPQFLGEELVSISRKDGTTLARHVAIMLGFWALIAGGVVLGSWAAGSEERSWIMLGAAYAGTACITIAAFCSGTIGATRRKWLRPRGSARAWRNAHASAGALGVLFVAVDLGGRVTSAQVAGSTSTSSIPATLALLALAGVAITGGVGLLIVPVLQRRLSMESLQLRAAPVDERARRLEQLALRLLEHWRLAHAALVVCFLLAVVLAWWT